MDAVGLRLVITVRIIKDERKKTGKDEKGNDKKQVDNQISGEWRSKWKSSSGKGLYDFVVESREEANKEPDLGVCGMSGRRERVAVDQDDWKVEKEAEREWMNRLKKWSWDYLHERSTKRKDEAEASGMNVRIDAKVKSKWLFI